MLFKASESVAIFISQILEKQKKTKIIWKANVEKLFSVSGGKNIGVIICVDPTSFVQWLRQPRANYMTFWLLLCSEALKPKVGIGSLVEAQWRSPDTELLLLRNKKQPPAIRHCLSLLTFFHSLECVFTWRRRPTNNLKVVLSSSFLSRQKVK